MRRSLFIALGIMAMIIGVESLFIESANIYVERGSTPLHLIDPTSVPGQRVFTWSPKEWFPWVVLAAGVLTVIYTFTLPRRIRASFVD